MPQCESGYGGEVCLLGKSHKGVHIGKEESWQEAKGEEVARCVHCGHLESDQVIIHDDEQGDIKYCQPCGAGWGVHAFEPPAADEVESSKVQVWRDESLDEKWVVGWRYGDNGAAVYIPREVEAAIRAQADAEKRLSETDRADIAEAQLRTERIANEAAHKHLEAVTAERDEALAALTEIIASINGLAWDKRSLLGWVNRIANRALRPPSTKSSPPARTGDSGA